jgi:hypothetical protein
LMVAIRLPIRPPGLPILGPPTAGLAVGHPDLRGM